MDFEIYQGGFFKRQWYFRIVATNGKTVAQSEGYKNRLDCEDTCKSIKAKIGDGLIVYV